MARAAKAPRIQWCPLFSTNILRRNVETSNFHTMHHCTFEFSCLERRRLLKVKLKMIENLESCQSLFDKRN